MVLGLVVYSGQMGFSIQPDFSLFKLLKMAILSTFRSVTTRYLPNGSNVAIRLLLFNSERKN
jgi:hypothetical protein